MAYEITSKMDEADSAFENFKDRITMYLSELNKKYIEQVHSLYYYKLDNILYVFTQQHPQRQDMTQDQFFSWAKLVKIKSFPSPRLVA